MLVKHAPFYAGLLQRFGIEPPFAVLASLVGVRGKRFLQGFPGGWPVDSRSVTLTQDQFHFVETIFENVPQDRNDAARQLRATLDHLANAAGIPSSPYFNENGDYTLDEPR